MTKLVSKFFSTHTTPARLAAALAAVAVVFSATARAAEEVLPPVTERFADAETQESPHFQKHVVPLMGRLGCNGRACHGSFQGQGGFRLSLFGYDFKADYLALTDEESPRIDTDNPLESLIITKPTSDDIHEGGMRYEVDSWSYHLIHKWIADGAQFDRDLSTLRELRVEPSEIQFTKQGQVVPLRAIAVWESGVSEDVTPLCRFTTNDSTIATIDEDGKVTSGDAGDTHVVVAYDKAVVPVPVLQPVTKDFGERYPKVATRTEVDELVVAKLSKLGIVPSDVCTDEEFLRRVSLDLTGTLPSPQAVRDFLADKSEDKRQRKIDELLETPAYAAWWTTKLCDFTGNNTDQTVNLALDRDGASKSWYEWIYRRVEENKPYDDLMAGIVLGKSREGDESYTEYCEEMSKIHGKGDLTFADRESMPYYWARRDFRQPEERAISFAHAFMGVRIQCAQCHKHPFDQWSKDDFDEFAKFFGGVTASNNSAPQSRKEYNAIIAKYQTKDLRGGQLRRKFSELLKEGKVVPFPEVYISHNQNQNQNRNRNRNKGKGGGDKQPAQQMARLLGGTQLDLAQIEDPRQPVMEWLRSADNPYFAPAFVNRVWAAYFGAGIVDPPDDLSLGNPPSNRALLEHLAQGFIANNFDMKWVHREILNSDTYQRTWRPNDTNLADRKNFSRALPRRLPAEVVHDAIFQATGTDEFVSRWQSEMDERAIAMPGAGTRNNNAKTYALNVFGRSTRESSCDCDRSDTPNLLQTIFLQNDQQVLQLIDRRGDGWLRHVAAEIGASESAKVPANVLTQFERIDESIKRLKDRPNAEAALKKVRQRRQQLVKRYGDPNKVVETEVADGVDYGQLVDDAYLRTLSRFPSESERQRSVQFIEEGESKVESFRGLVWALINTKEFIVNH